jgi:hypothetical protein
MAAMKAGSSAGGDDASSPNYETAVEYLRDMESGLRYWYQAAETKAQVVLAINGAFLALLGGLLLTKREDLARTVAVFGPETWVFLVGMAASIAGSIYCAVACLVTRTRRRNLVKTTFTTRGVDPAKASTYVPEVTTFFVYLAALQVKPFAERMRTIDSKFVFEALASTPVYFSRFVVRKHRWVDRAFILTGVTLGFFLCLGMSYLVRVVVAS